VNRKRKKEIKTNHLISKRLNIKMSPIHLKKSKFLNPPNFEASGAFLNKKKKKENFKSSLLLLLRL